MRFTMASFAALLVIGCDGSDTLREEVSSLVDDPIVSHAKEQVVSQAPDPAAAQFRNVRQVGDMVCGEVNNKNRLGAYNGFTPFIYRRYSNQAFSWELHGIDLGELGAVQSFDGCQFPEAPQCFPDALVSECLAPTHSELVAKGLPAQDLGTPKSLEESLNEWDALIGNVEQTDYAEPHEPEPESFAAAPRADDYHPSTIELRSAEIRLAKRWFDNSELCRIGTANPETHREACHTARALHSELKSRNLCLGRMGQAETEYQWHACKDDSLR